MSHEPLTTPPLERSGTTPPVTETVKDVASRSAGEAKQLGTEALEGARNLVRTGSSEVRGQLQQQTVRAAEAARTAGSQLVALANGDTQQAERAQQLARDLGSRLQDLASRLDGEGLDGLTRRTSDFARRRPLVFLGGMAVAGFVAGRYAKVLMDRPDDPGSARSWSAGGNGQLATPLAAPGYAADPALAGTVGSDPSGAGLGASTASGAAFGAPGTAAGGLDAPPAWRDA